MIDCRQGPEDNHELVMKAWVTKNLDYVSWDKIGMGLSFLCALHCLLTPVLILSLPFLARYYLSHPAFHVLLALAIIPVGFIAFYAGIRHHRNYWVLVLGLPGLFLVAATPYFVHALKFPWNEPLLMIIGSLSLLGAHWLNRRGCRSCARHSAH